MNTILLTNQYSESVMAEIEKIIPDGFDVVSIPERTEKCCEEYACHADYIIAGGGIYLSRQILESAKRLKMIHRSGVGLDCLDLDAIKRKDIPLYVNSGVNTESVAEYALLLILASLRRLTIVHNETVDGKWTRYENGMQSRELLGMTVGVVGMGNIGQRLVQLLKPFNVNILYNSRSKKKEIEQHYGVTYVGLDELLMKSDIICLACSLNEDTKGMIDHKSLDMVKKGAVLINIARGKLVDLDALDVALKIGKLSYAGIDVHAIEPIPEDYSLKKLDNIIISPHIAGVTADSFNRMMSSAFRNIECFENGQLELIEKFRYL